MLAASTILVSPRLKVPAATLFVLGMLLNGLGTLATGLAPVLLAAIGLQALAGTGNAVQVVASDTLVQETVARSMLGRVFGLVQLAAVAGSSVAALAGGLLLDVTSARAVFVVGGIGVLAVLVLSWLFLAREPGPRLRRAHS
jgi:MFS family permease